MEFSVEKHISNFIANQFPQFYREDGEYFILFMKAYYEWMESEGGVILESRELFDYRDIDNTLEKFLEYFQKKYLYGIPFNIITSKRFLLKHILDVYRSKGTIQCYNLLFKLIYDEDVTIYLPGIDVLKASDGTWEVPTYLEVSDAPKITEFVGKIVVGTSSGTKAMVENYVREAFDKDIVTTIYISNILPRGGEFVIGERIILEDDIGNFSAIEKSPTLLGSLGSLEIQNGGQSFSLGDILKISSYDIDTGELISHGMNGLLKVTEITKGKGQLNFDIVSGGFGFKIDALSFLYNNEADTQGQGASFDLFSISDTRELTFNTDLICDYLTMNLDSFSYGFPGNTSANLTYAITENIKLDFLTYNGSGSKGYSNNDVLIIVNPNGGNAVVKFSTNTTGGDIQLTTLDPGRAFISASAADYQDMTFLITNVAHGSAYGNTNVENFTAFFTNSAATLQFQSNAFGTIASLTNIRTGNGYTLPANVFIRSVQTSKNLEGTISYSTSSKTVTGTNTKFQKYFANNDVIYLKANNTLSTSEEYQVIKEVVSNTELTLYGKPNFSSTASAKHKAAPSILPSQFSIYEEIMFRPDGSINGLNDNITAVPSVGENIVSKVKSVNSGKAYIQGEFVKAYLFGALEVPTIKAAGIDYKVGDPVVFTGGGIVSAASGKVSTINGSGGVTGISMDNLGSGYTSTPNISIKSDNGRGAVLEVTIQQFNTFSEVTGRVQKKPVGQGEGYWSTTRGFLNADKYIHDSYYYQDYSYEIQVPLILDQYKGTLYSTFHPSGSELFGKYCATNKENGSIDVLYDSDYAITYVISDQLISLRADNDDVATISCDNDFWQCDAQDAFTIIANTVGFDYTTDTLKISEAERYFNVGDYVFYRVPENNTAIVPLIANSYYYVSFANNSEIALSSTIGGPNVDITDARHPSVDVQSHEISIVQRVITGNVTGFNSNTDTFKVASANVLFQIDDRVYYYVGTGSQAIYMSDSSTGNSFYYVAFANATDLALTTNPGGGNINIRDTRTTLGTEVHKIFVAQGAI